MPNVSRHIYRSYIELDCPIPHCISLDITAVGYRTWDDPYLWTSAYCKLPFWHTMLVPQRTWCASGMGWKPNRPTPLFISCEGCEHTRRSGYPALFAALGYFHGLRYLLLAPIWQLNLFGGVTDPCSIASIDKTTGGRTSTGFQSPGFRGFLVFVSGNSRFFRQSIKQHEGSLPMSEIRSLGVSWLLSLAVIPYWSI